MGSFSLPWPFGKGTTRSNQEDKRKTTKDKRGNHKDDADEESYLEEFGVTQQLRDYVKGFTINTFKDFTLQDDQRAHLIDGSTPLAINVRKDLTEWQERHATLVLSKVKEMSQLRYVLCPRYLKEEHFWRIYFLLVKSYVSPYEIHALQKAKLRMMGLENEKSVDKAAIEVEMTDAKHSSGSSLTLQCDSNPLVDGDRGADGGTDDLHDTG